jgi:hypothetical protein
VYRHLSITHSLTINSRGFKECLNHHKTANWCEEGVARTKFHLANVYRRLNKSEGEATKLYAEAKTVLDRLLQFDQQGWLEGETNEDILFDHLRSYGARFTGTGLLKRFRENFDDKVHKLAPRRIDDLLS